MHNYKLLLFGGCVMLLLASISLLIARPFPVYAGDEVCDGSGCSVTDTTLADFVQGNFYATGLRNQFDGEVQLLPVGLASQWVTDTNRLPGQRKDLSAVIYTDTIYVIGGLDAGNPRSEIFAATTSITGAITGTGWITATNMPNARYAATAVISPTATGAFLYVIGGIGPSISAYTSTIYYRSINTNGNFTGSWVTTSITTEYLSAGTNIGLAYARAVVHNGFLYVIGGYDGSVLHKEIIRAPINPDGSLSPSLWTLDQPLPEERYTHASAIWLSGESSDYLYVMGGRATPGSTTAQATVWISSFSITDTLSQFITSTYPLPVGFYAHSGVQGNGELFVTGGYQTGVSQPITNSVQSALIDASGELRVNWNTSFPLPQGRAFHGSVFNSGGEVYVIGGNAVGGSPTDTVYHGSTSGVASSYSPTGTFTSRIINLGGLEQLTSFVANTTISATNPTTMTLLYRTATSQSGLLAAGWTNLGGPQLGVNVSTTFTLSNPSATFVQYRAAFTSTAPYTYSPTLNAFQIKYPLPGDFEIGANPTTKQVTHGNSITYTAILTSLNGFNSPVTLSVTGLPTATNAIFGSNPIVPSANAVLTITTPTTLTAAIYPLTLIGNSGNITHTTTIFLDVNAGPDFSMSTSPTMQNVIQGQTGVFTSTLTALYGFTSTVSLSLNSSSLPAGATATLGTSIITPTASTAITVTTLPTISVGSYPLTLTGNSGSITRTSTFTLNIITPSDFLISVVPSSRSITQGQSVTYTAQLTSVLGFNSPVTMTLSGLPSGASSIFGKNPITPTASTALTITTQSTVTVGVYLLTLTGNSGSISHNSTFTLSISPPPSAVLPDFRISSIQAPPAAGTDGYRTITITVMNQGTANYAPVRGVNTRLAPVFRQPTTTRKPSTSFSSPKAYTDTTHYFFYVAPYIDRASNGVADVGNCVNQSAQIQQPPYVYAGALPKGAFTSVQATCWLTAGTHYFYARTDVCDAPPDTCSENYGYVLEKIESNNVSGPVNSGNTLAGPTIFLPFIRR